MTDRRSLVGRTFELSAFRIEAEGAQAYARAVDDDPARHAGRGTAPEFYAVRIIAPLWRSIYQARELRTTDQQVLHVEQRMRWYRELRVGETVSATAQVVNMVSLGFNDAAIIRSLLLDADERPVVLMESTLAIQGGSGLPAERRRAFQPRKGIEAARSTRLFDAETPARYADASDDHNPLHLDDEAARAAGHPGRLIHGMCTLATGTSTLVTSSVRPPTPTSATCGTVHPARVPGDDVEYSAYATSGSGTYLGGARRDGRPVLKNWWLRLSGNG